MLMLGGKVSRYSNRQDIFTLIRSSSHHTNCISEEINTLSPEYTFPSESTIQKTVFCIDEIASM